MVWKNISHIYLDHSLNKDLHKWVHNFSKNITFYRTSRRMDYINVSGYYFSGTKLVEFSRLDSRGPLSHTERLLHLYFKWRIKVNKNKSVHVTFSFRKGSWLWLINTPGQRQIPAASLERRPTWGMHKKAKRKQLNITMNELAENFEWLIGRSSTVSAELKLLVYKSIIRTIWT